MKIKRSEFLKIGSLTLATGVFGKMWAGGSETGRERKKQRTPVIHATDLYHFHCDPDDHWDLATIYSLAYLGAIDLQGILIDYPTKPGLGDPDAMGIAQMNYITGKAVPFVVGSPFPMTSRNDIQPQANCLEHQGVNWLLDTLKETKQPVVINIVGAATSVAIALKKDPGLFQKKCKAIYLNAGSANSLKDKKLEYNVKLNPFAFAAIFDATCPVYWMPCTTRTNIGEVGEYGTYYRFVQKKILPSLPGKVQNFFLFMLDKKKSHEWLSYLNGDPEINLLEKFGEDTRHMWCTAGFLHSAGKKVTAKGTIVPLASGEKSVFCFIPIKARCLDIGYVDWKIDKKNGDRFIFHVNNTGGYQEAVTLAMKDLLAQLPK